MIRSFIDTTENILNDFFKDNGIWIAVAVAIALTAVIVTLLLIKPKKSKKNN